jgi:hypothetical protein
MSRIIHILVHCNNCYFKTKNNFPEISKMRAEAIRHSKKTGHYVIVETGTSDYYVGGGETMKLNHKERNKIIQILFDYALVNPKEAVGVSELAAKLR